MTAAVWSPSKLEKGLLCSAHTPDAVLEMVVKLHSLKVRVAL